MRSSSVSSGSGVGSFANSFDTFLKFGSVIPAASRPFWAFRSSSSVNSRMPTRSLMGEACPVEDNIYLMSINS